MKNLGLLIIVIFSYSCSNRASESPLIKKYANVMVEKPGIENENVKVWNIKKTDLIRINLVEMSGELSKHKHPDAEHSLVVLEGEVKAMVGDSIVTLLKGDFISIPKNVPHKYWTITSKAYLVSMDAPYYDADKTVRLE